jgi:hypothetical protein
MVGINCAIAPHQISHSRKHQAEHISHSVLKLIVFKEGKSRGERELPLIMPFSGASPGSFAYLYDLLKGFGSSLRDGKQKRPTREARKDILDISARFAFRCSFLQSCRQ